MIERLLKHFDMDNCNGVSTPMTVGFQIGENTLDKAVPYRELICSLMYIAVMSRPDIQYSVSLLSRVLDKPTAQAWKEAKRILRYLQATKDLSLTFSKGEKMLIGYSDADWAGDKQSRKSVSGFISFYCGNPISWFSKKQSCVALSTAESEYIAAASSAQELMNQKGVISEISDSVGVVLKIDNVSAISMIKTFENSKRCKHIDIRYNFVKDLYCEKQLCIEYVLSENNIADVFTKALSKEKFLKFRENMKLQSI